MAEGLKHGFCYALFFLHLKSSEDDSRAVSGEPRRTHISSFSTAHLEEASEIQV